MSQQVTRKQTNPAFSNFGKRAVTTVLLLTVAGAAGCVGSLFPPSRNNDPRYTTPRPTEYKIPVESVDLGRDCVYRLAIDAKGNFITENGKYVLEGLIYAPIKIGLLYYSPQKNFKKPVTIDEALFMSLSEDVFLTEGAARQASAAVRKELKKREQEIMRAVQADLKKKKPEELKREMRFNLDDLIKEMNAKIGSFTVYNPVRDPAKLAAKLKAKPVASTPQKPDSKAKGTQIQRKGIKGYGK